MSIMRLITTAVLISKTVIKQSHLEVLNEMAWIYYRFGNWRVVLVVKRTSDLEIYEHIRHTQFALMIGLRSTRHVCKKCDRVCRKCSRVCGKCNCVCGKCSRVCGKLAVSVGSVSAG